MGELDRAALQQALADDPDDTLTLLVAMSTATDEELRRQVRALAPRLLLDRARTGAVRRRGIGRPRAVPAHLGGELDLDASMDAVAAAHAEQRPPGLDELVARDWGRPELAVCLVIDRSGSMSGARLATAAVTAAACLVRAPGEHAVVAFARQGGRDRAARRQPGPVAGRGRRARAAWARDDVGEQRPRGGAQRSSRSLVPHAG